jgi:hypothetical protein
MSRPQYQFQPGPHVVNGGLIDFRDNFNTGNPEHISALYPAPGIAAPASLPGFHSPSLGCVSGPPAYMHINGVMYKPVDDGLGAEASATVKAAKAPAKPETVAAKDESVKVLSEAELDERVRQRVEEFLSTQRHGRVRHAPREPDPEPRRYVDDEPQELDSGAEVSKCIRKINAEMAASSRKPARRA